MIVLDWGPQKSIQAGLVLIFGSGLIGSPIKQSLLQAVPSAGCQTLDWNWQDWAASEINLETLAQSLLTKHARPRFSVVWAAGRSGFSSDQAAMQQEQRALEGVLRVANRISTDLPLEDKSVHLVSSAGGLFEGVTSVEALSDPCPRRPYGEGKLMQERLVSSCDSLGSRKIYRPSSVYGYLTGARANLVSALLSAALQGKPARIVGALSTQRDYVFNWDVGRYIADQILSPGNEEIATYTLASGKPTDIYQIIQLVENQTAMFLYREIDPRPSNALDNTFLPQSLPPNFHPIGLVEGISKTAMAMKYAEVGAN